MILCVRPRKKVKFFSLLVTDYLQFAELQTLTCFNIGWNIFKIECTPAVCRNVATSEQAMAS